jgi:flap endonuclease-1
MGIKDLNKFLKKYNPSCLVSSKMIDYKNKTIAIDTSLIIYKYISAMRKTGKDLTSNDGKITSHLLGILNLIVKLLKLKITPVFIFDGKPPEIKKNTLKKRYDSKKLAEEKLENEELTDEQKITYFMQSTRITSEIIDDTKELLDTCGIPYIQAPEEADPQCVCLLENKLIYAVATEDMDLLTFKCERLLKNFFSNKDEEIIEINYNKMIEGLNLDNNQFLDLCILLGCDYLPTLQGLGLVKSYNYIKKYKSIENILELKDGKNSIITPEEYNYNEVRDYFKKSSSTCIIPKEEDLKIKKNSNENDKIYNFLVTKCNFNIFKYNTFISAKNNFFIE